MITLQIQLLGDFRIVRGDGEPVTGLSSPRLQSFLAYLLLHRSASQPRQHIAFQLWPDSTEAQARTNLRFLLHQLRGALPAADRFLAVEPQTLQWNPDAPFTLDAAEFDQAVTHGDLKQAVELYRGELLSSCYDDWIRPERERLRGLLIHALELLVERAETERDYNAAIRYAQRLLLHEPLQEAAYCSLMRLYALNGDRAGALRTYHTCATVLLRELAVEPAPPTREMYERLLHSNQAVASQAAAAEVAHLKPFAGAPLVGRKAEWARLEAAWRAAARGAPQMVLLAGEAGIGKTRLAEEFLQWAERQGIANAAGRCYAAEGSPAFGPVTTLLRARPLPVLDEHWLSEIARLVPEVLTQHPRVAPPSPMIESWQRQHFFEALARAFLAHSPQLLLIDDLQWCDRDTLEWLHFLLRFDPKAELLVVGTFRPEEAACQPALGSFLADLNRTGRAQQIDLDALDAENTASLAAHVASRPLSRSLIADLYRRTEGNPLFIVETMRSALVSTHAGEGDHAERASTNEEAEITLRPELPSKVQAVITDRLAQLSPSAHDLVNLAATIGREFTFEVLKRASDADPDTLVRGLDELWHRRIIREQGADAYDFTHDQIRDTAYARLSRARKSLLHLRVAQALEAMPDHRGSLSAQLAAHYERAGRVEQAIRYYHQAALAAQRLYANREAIEQLDRAIALLEGERAKSEGDTRKEGASKEGASEEGALKEGAAAQERQKTAAQLYEDLGGILELTGEHEEARRAYQRGQEQALARDPLSQARLWHGIANTFKSQGLYPQATESYAKAERALGASPAEPEAAWWTVWIDLRLDKMWLAYGEAQPEEMAQLAQEVGRALDGHATPAQRARFLQLRSMMNLRRDRYVVSEDTLGYSQEAVAAARESNDAFVLREAEFYYGFGLLWYGDLDAAEEHLRKALQLAAQAGDPNNRVLALTYLTIVHRKRKRVKETRDYAAQSLAAATAGQRESYIAAAEANLAWVAWCEKDVAALERNAISALERWKSTTYPFRWLALWPLIGLDARRERWPEAMEYACALLEPLQQRLPEALSQTLTEAIQAREQGRTKRACARLSQALEQAQKVRLL